jgi:hypothetical protein
MKRDTLALSLCTGTLLTSCTLAAFPPQGWTADSILALMVVSTAATVYGLKMTCKGMI